MSRPWLVQVSVGLGVIITTFDTGGINVSLHTLATHFGVAASTVAWLPLLMFLVVTSTLLLFGRLSDQLGSKWIFAGGFAVYALGSALAGLATSFGLLIAFRGLQAIGVSMLSANSMAILTECFPPHKRGAVIGINSAVVGLGYFAGPILAGQLIANLGWRFVFLANVPVCLAGLFMAVLVLPMPRRRSQRLRFDFLGAFLFACMATSLLLAVNAAKSGAVFSAAVLGLVGLGAVTLGAFLFVERRVAEPMIDLGLFHSRLFSLSLASAFFLFVGTAGQDMLVPLFAQQILLQSPATAGMIAAVVPFVRMLLASPSGLLSDRIGSRWLSGLGAGLTALGGLGLYTLTYNPSIVWLVGSLVLIGLGTGLFFSPNMHATMASVPPDRLGTAAGALGVRRNLGQSFGVALAACLLQAGGAGAEAGVPGFQLAFGVEATSVTVAVLAAVSAGSTLTAARRAGLARAAK
ncbi:MAG: MFS transporter [Dehalococcoidales bacterium]|nr:MFS transporter [Dehalococcoidales bacterium]